MSAIYFKQYDKGPVLDKLVEAGYTRPSAEVLYNFCEHKGFDVDIDFVLSRWHEFHHIDDVRRYYNEDNIEEVDVFAMSEGEFLGLFREDTDVLQVGISTWLVCEP